MQLSTTDSIINQSGPWNHDYSNGYTNIFWVPHTPLRQVSTYTHTNNHLFSNPVQKSVVSVSQQTDIHPPHTIRWKTLSILGHTTKRCQHTPLSGVCNLKMWLPMLGTRKKTNQRKRWLPEHLYLYKWQCSFHYFSTTYTGTPPQSFAQAACPLELCINPFSNSGVAVSYKTHTFISSPQQCIWWRPPYLSVIPGRMQSCTPKHLHRITKITCTGA